MSRNRAEAEQVESFNGVLKALACDLVVRYPTDPKIDRAKKRIMLAIDTWPVWIIDTIGPILYGYRDAIYAADETFFLQNSFDAEFEGSVDMEKVDYVTYIIPKVKGAWAEANPSDKDAYKEKVLDLLDAYVEYLSHKLPIV